MQRIRPTKPAITSAQGFTIVELVIVIVIVGVIFPIFSYLFVNMYEDSANSDNKAKASTAIVQAMLYIDDAARSSSAFTTTAASPYTDAYGSSNLGTAGLNAWSHKGTSATNRVLITKNYATTANALNTGRQPVFKDTVTFNCTTQMSYQPQLQYLTIFFVKDNTLYKRLLTDTTSALCAGNVQAQKQTCPPYISSGSWDATCQANDEILVTNVSAFSIDYFQISQDGSSTQIDPTYASTDPDILIAADYANITISASATPSGVVTTMTQRVTKVNY